MHPLAALFVGLLFLLSVTAIFKLFPGANGVIACLIIFSLISVGSMSTFIVGLLVIMVSMVHGLGGFCWFVLGVGGMVASGMI